MNLSLLFQFNLAMIKIIVFLKHEVIMKIILALFMVFISTDFANAYSGRAREYYDGEISTDEYLDSLIGPRYQGDTTIHHGDGSKSLIRPNGTGGTIYHSDGSKSIYY